MLLKDKDDEVRRLRSQNDRLEEDLRRTTFELTAQHQQRQATETLIVDWLAGLRDFGGGQSSDENSNDETHHHINDFLKSSLRRVGANLSGQRDEIIRLKMLSKKLESVVADLKVKQELSNHDAQQAAASYARSIGGDDTAVGAGDVDRTVDGSVSSSLPSRNGSARDSRECSSTTQRDRKTVEKDEKKFTLPKEDPGKPGGSASIDAQNATAGSGKLFKGLRRDPASRRSSLEYEVSRVMRYDGRRRASLSGLLTTSGGKSKAK